MAKWTCRTLDKRGVCVGLGVCVCVCVFLFFIFFFGGGRGGEKRRRESTDGVRLDPPHTQAREKSVRLECMVCAPVGAKYETDPLRVHQILDNLLDNAIAFTAVCYCTVKRSLRLSVTWCPFLPTRSK